MTYINDARDEILRKLRTSLKGCSPVLSENYEDLRQNLFPSEPTDLLTQFTHKLTASRAEIYKLSQANWVENFIKILQEKGLNKLLYSPSTKHGSEIERQVKREDINLNLHKYDSDDPAWRERLFFTIDCSITSGIGGIANTGTIIVRPSEQEPRLMNIVPPTHFLLLRASMLYPNLFLASKALDLSNHLATNLIFISGPSKTADIEQKLAYGAHGPKELIVLLIMDE